MTLWWWNDAHEWVDKMVLKHNTECDSRKCQKESVDYECQINEICSEGQHVGCRPLV